jgi:hypothetical protein
VRIKEAADIEEAGRPRPSWRRLGIIALALVVIVLTMTWASAALWVLLRLIGLL